MKKTNSGFLIIEILIAVLLFSMVTLAIFSMISVSQVRTQKSDYSADAVYLVQEGTEIALDNLKNDWSGISAGTYYPVFYDSGMDKKWVLEAGTEENLQTRFKRKIEISGVCRNVTSGEREACTSGVPDTNSRLIRTTVEWMKSSLGNPVTVELLVIKAS